MEPFAYICQIPGKDIRSQMIDAYNCWLKVDASKLDLVKKVVAMLHNGSLL
jgi:geranylgeranyl diphosphate synthase type 3